MRAYRSGKDLEDFSIMVRDILVLMIHLVFASFSFGNEGFYDKNSLPVVPKNVTEIESSTLRFEDDPFVPTGGSAVIISKKGYILTALHNLSSGCLRRSVKDANKELVRVDNIASNKECMFSIGYQNTLTRPPED